MTPNIPMSSPDLSDADRAAVEAVLRTPHLSMGSWTPEFEGAIARIADRRYGIAVSSGTAGLHLCIRAAGITCGDLVLTTPFSFVASTNVLLYERAIPIFVDVDPKSGNMDPDLAAQVAADLVAGGTRAASRMPRRSPEKPRPLKGILPVDVFGQPADLDAFRNLADQHGLSYVEDACEALGALYRDRPAGSSGDSAVFAFYPNKQITTGEGGMIVTDDEPAACKMRALRNQGRAAGDTWLQHTDLGYNYRLDEMSAALGVSQASRLDELLSKRSQVASWYAQRLVSIDGVQPPTLEDFTTRASWFVYVIRFDPGLDRNKIANSMQAAGVDVRPYFLPIHLQPYMVQQFGYRAGDFPVTEDLGRRGLALPFSSVMLESQVDAVCQILERALETR